MREKEKDQYDRLAQAIYDMSHAGGPVEGVAQLLREAMEPKHPHYRPGEMIYFNMGEKISEPEYRRLQIEELARRHGFPLPASPGDRTIRRPRMGGETGQRIMQAPRESERYRKKPVVIEAFQMTPERRESNADWPGWLHEAWNKESSEESSLFPTPGSQTLSIHTLEGDHVVSFGDFIIRGVKGELYPCKPDIFAKTYEKEKKTGLTFGQALEALKTGHKVARAGWNGKGMYAVMMPGYPEGVQANEATAKAHGIDKDTTVIVRPYFVLKTAQNDLAMWAPSGSDALAEDWELAD